MATRDKYFPGTGLSRYLPPQGRAWEDVIFQSSKPLLDSELVFSQEVSAALQNLLQERTISSGWLRGPGSFDPLEDFTFPSTIANELQLRKRTALVAGMPVVVEFTNTTTEGQNILQFSASPIHGGAPPDVKRTDFVFLEVWRCVVSTSPRASATTEVITNADIVAGDDLVINGVSLSATAGVPGVDEFQIGANEAATATNIANAINNPANSFDGICLAVVDATNVNLVNLYAADAFAGAAGNALTLSLALTNVGSVEVNGGAGPTTFSGGSDTSNKPTQATIYRHGNTQAPSGVNLADDIADPVLGTESTKRVQIQYRIRITGQSEAVNFKTQNGFSNASVLARGTQGAPVATYPFVPADGTTVSGSSSAVAYGTVDPGLWVAGSGSSASAAALGTVDGYVYAIPIGFLFRRDDAYNGGAGAGFDPLSNTNGALPKTHGVFVNPIIGAIPANTSDRPDGYFHDVFQSTDWLDLRRNVSPSGVDLKVYLEQQMAALLDGTLGTWAIDAADKNVLGAGSGDVGTRFLVCNEIGRSSAKGGVAPASGSTTRGDEIGDFDHIRRRFADWPVAERRVFPVLPTATSVANPGLFVTKTNALYTTWQEDDVIVIDLDALDATGLGDWSNVPSGAPTGGGEVSNLWPPGTTVTDIISISHDDGNFGGAINRNAKIKQIVGIGTPKIEITLEPNNTAVNGGLAGATHDMVITNPGADTGSPRRVFIELQITYPIGSGTTDTPYDTLTPAASVYAQGAILENDTTQRPDDWEEILAPSFREGRREIGLEYVANDGSGAGSGTPISEQVVSESPLNIQLSRRVFGSGSTVISVTDMNTALARSVDTSATRYGSSDQRVILQGGSPLSGAGQTLCNVEYFAQDPLPNWGAVGYQLAVYYRAVAPQTVGVQAGAPVTFPLPASLVVRPVAMSQNLWTGTGGKGSSEISFPYGNGLDGIPVNGDLSPASFAGEWILQASVQISVGDFDAGTGLLNLNSMVPIDPNAQQTFSDIDIDTEFRAAYKAADSATYRPFAAAQPLSGVAPHKVFIPFLAVAQADNVYFRKGEVLLIVLSRFAALDGDNTIRFTDTNNETCAALYRTRGLLILAE